MSEKDLMVIENIRSAAKSRVISGDALNTLITAALTVFMAFIMWKPDGGVYTIPLVLLVLLVVVSVYGLQDTLPYVLYWCNPWSHPMFRGMETKEEKIAYAQKVEEETRNRVQHAFQDMTMTEHFFVLDGHRCFDVVPIDQTVWIYQKVFASASKSGVSILIFVDKKMRRHELILKTGKKEDPLGQMALICETVPETASHIIIGDNKEAKKQARAACGKA